MISQFSFKLVTPMTSSTALTASAGDRLKISFQGFSSVGVQCPSFPERPHGAFSEGRRVCPIWWSPLFKFNGPISTLGISNGSKHVNSSAPSILHKLNVNWLHTLLRSCLTRYLCHPPLKLPRFKKLVVHCAERQQLLGYEDELGQSMTSISPRQRYIDYHMQCSWLTTCSGEASAKITSIKDCGRR